MNKLEWGNVAQWLSAICALGLAIFTINGLFFSRSSSQELIAYLQSELALRNQRIAALEARERELQLSVTNAQSSFGDLARQKAMLEKQVEFSLVKEKMGARLSSTIGRAIALRLVEESDRPEGVRARTERPWDAHLSRVRETAEQLPEGDRPLARAVVANFVQQCGRLSSAAIQIPALRIPKDADVSAYSNERDKHPVVSRLNALAKQVEKLERDIDVCFLSLAP